MSIYLYYKLAMLCGNTINILKLIYIIEHLNKTYLKI